MDYYIANKQDTSVGDNGSTKQIGVVDTTIKSYCKMLDNIKQVGADQNDYQQYLNQILNSEFRVLLDSFNKQYEQLVVQMVQKLDRQWGRQMQNKVNEQIYKDYQKIK